jgi:putative hydrolase of the HAD superfamily
MAARTPLSPLRVVTLDSTGTLIACPAMGEIYSEVLARHGVAVSAADVRRVFPVVWKELDCLTPAGRDRFVSFEGGSRGFWSRLLERVCELLDASAPGKFAAAELFHRFALPAAWVVYPDAVPALEAMRSLGLRLAVVSNFDERLPELLAGLDLARRVDLVVPSSSIGLAKPNPKLFTHALARLGVEPRAALHVGDHRLEDVEGAQAAGMEAVLLDRAGAGARGVTAATARDLLELAAALERRQGSGGKPVMRTL